MRERPGVFLETVMADPAPESNAQYLQNEYWNTRFDTEQQYDWFKDYSQFKHLCTPYLQPAARILILGCGNSTLTQDLYCDGYTNLTSVDLSEVVIARMRAKAATASQDGITWQVSICSNCCTCSAVLCSACLAFEHVEYAHML